MGLAPNTSSSGICSSWWTLTFLTVPSTHTAIFLLSYRAITVLWASIKTKYSSSGVGGVSEISCLGRKGLNWTRAIRRSTLSSSEPWKHFFKCILLNFLFRGWSEGGPGWQRLNELTFTPQHSGTQTPAAGTAYQHGAWAAGAAPQGWLREPIPSFPTNKHTNIYPFWIWFNLNQCHRTRLILPLASSALPVAAPPAPAPSSLTGTWLEILRPYRLPRLPVFQTKDTFNTSRSLLLAALVIALEGTILKMENRAVQSRCPTATPRLGRPTNDRPGPPRPANDRQPKLQDRVQIPSYQSFWLLNQLNRYIRAEARPTSY